MQLDLLIKIGDRCARHLDVIAAKEEEEAVASEANGI